MMMVKASGDEMMRMAQRAEARAGRRHKEAQGLPQVGVQRMSAKQKENLRLMRMTMTASELDGVTMMKTTQPRTCEAASFLSFLRTQKVWL